MAELSLQLGRDITIPDLSDAGMTFVGGRLFFVNGQPVGQIAYHDRHSRLTGFCLKRNPTGREEGSVAIFARVQAAAFLRT